MTELDFDELDKAVNNLMQDAMKEKTPTDGAADDAPAASPSGPTQPAAMVMPRAAPLATKRRGKFMDVMAPAGSKKPLVDNLVTHKPSAMQPIVSATANTPTPIEAEADDAISTIPNDMRPVAKAQPAPIATDSKDETTTEIRVLATGEYATDPAPAHEWPAPKEVTEVVDLNDNLPEADQALESDNLPASVTTQDGAGGTSPAPEDAVAEPEAPATSEPRPADTADGDGGELTTIVTPDTVQQSPSTATPLPGSVMTSPFLPDAKVQKRPLGGDAAAADSADTTAAHTQEALPREYNADLMNLETDTSVTPRAAVSQQAAPAATESRSPTAQSGAIFDTDAYHTPLKQPTKSKSGWLTIIWILLLLVIGAASGAAYYFYSIQH